MSKSQIIRIEEEYRNVATFLAKTNPPSDQGMGISQYDVMMRERMRLKQELWKLGGRDVILRIDKECVEEQRRRQRSI